MYSILESETPMNEPNTSGRNYQLPGMPNLEQVQRTLAEVESGTLPANQRAEKVQYLQESVVAIENALPSVEQLQGLTRGIEQLLHNIKGGTLRTPTNESGSISQENDVI